MICFVAYTAAVETPNDFLWAGQLPKIAFSGGDLDPI